MAGTQVVTPGAGAPTSERMAVLEPRAGVGARAKEHRGRWHGYSTGYAFRLTPLLHGQLAADCSR